MQSLCQTYYSFRNSVRPLLDASKPQRENICLLAYGLFAAGNSQLARIAAVLPLPIRIGSATQRLERLVKNNHVHPVRVYAPVARLLLSRFNGGRVRLIIDGTFIERRIYLLFVAVAYRGRALPIAWLTQEDVMNCAFWDWKQLLDEVARLLPSDVRVVLMGDREFSTNFMITYCLERRWNFCLRAVRDRKLSDEQNRVRHAQEWAVMNGLMKGGKCFVTGLSIPKIGAQQINLVCGWSCEDQYDEPWYILTDLPADGHVLRLYNNRFHIEEMFRDFKECGFRLEHTRIRAAERVDRLILAICVAYVWLLGTGSWLSKRGLRRFVDRKKQRQLSHYQIGLRYVQHTLHTPRTLPSAIAIYT